MNLVYFITGIDTGVGKTVAAGMAARFLRERGIRTATVKLAQTGCRGVSEDLLLHRRLSGTGPLPEDGEGLTAPQIFEFPASPHLAAAREGKTVDTNRIADCVNRVSGRYAVTLVEGAGGLAVPLADDLLTIDFVAQMKWPAILVASGKLGGINHALLSLEAIARRKMAFAGIIYNYAPEADPEIDLDTPRVLHAALLRLGLNDIICRLGKIDFGNPSSPDFSQLFRGVLS